MKIQCIYKIINKANKKIYIGSSVNLLSRWNAHLECLIKNKHHNIYLQKDFNEYGIDCFQFEIMEYFYKPISKNDLLRIESKYILKNNSIDKNIGYNISLPVFENKKKCINVKVKNIELSEELVENILKNLTITTLTKDKHFEENKDKEYCYCHNWFIKDEYKNCNKAQKALQNYYRNTVNSKGKDFYWNSYIDIKDKLISKGVKKAYNTGEQYLKDKRNKLAFMMYPQVNPFTNDLWQDCDKIQYSINMILQWIYNVSDINKEIFIFIPNPNLAKQIQDMRNNMNCINSNSQ